MPHVLAQDLRDAILQAAIQGKLTVQNTNDYSAYELVSEAGKALTIDTIDGQRVKKKEVVSLLDDDNEFEIPDNWCWTRLGSVCVIARGGSPRPIKSYITDREDGINWIKIGDTEKNGKYISSTKEKIIPEGMKRSRFVHAGDFLLTNSMSFGRPYILKIDGCIHDGWLVISQPTEVFNQDYLYYLLSSGYAYKQFSDLTSGAVVQNLNSDKVANAVFPVPPIEEQARIVAKVDELMAKIDEYEKIEKELIELQKAFPGNMKDAILQAAMQGKLTERLSEDSDVNTLLGSIRSTKERLIKEKKIKKEKPLDHIGLDESFDIPDNWTMTQFGEIFNVRSAMRIHESDWRDSGVPFLRGRELVKLSKTGELTSDVFIEESFYEELKNKGGIPKKDDILITAVGTLGKTYVVNGNEGKYYYKDAYILCLENYGVNPNYIKYLLDSPISQLIINDSTSKGTTVAQLTINKLKSMPVPLPPIEEQQRIVNKLDQLLPLCEQLEKMAA